MKITEQLLKEISTELAYSSCLSEDDIYALLHGKLMSKPKKPNNTNKVFDYWCDAFEVAYGRQYPISNFAKEKSMAKKLVTMYNDDLTHIEEIIDTAMRLYPSKFKSLQFPYPTLGAMVSWLAAKVEPLVIANNTEEIVITDQDGNDPFEIYDKKWGL